MINHQLLMLTVMEFGYLLYLHCVAGARTNAEKPVSNVYTFSFKNHWEPLYRLEECSKEDQSNLFTSLPDAFTTKNKSNSGSALATHSLSELCVYCQY